MIRFQLRCPVGDHFEAWFRSNDDFDRQEKDGLLACPACGSAEIAKALMTPTVPSSTRGRSSEPVVEAPEAPAPDTGAATARVGNDPKLGRMMELVREMTRQVRENSEHVGDRFAEEARKIHYDEAPARSIYGEATAIEVRELTEEGIGFHPLPTLPEDHN